MTRRVLLVVASVLAGCSSSTPPHPAGAPSPIATELLAAVGAPASSPAAATLQLPPPRSLDDMYTELRQVGDATGRRPQADAVVKGLRDRVNAVLRAVGDKANGVTYYHEVDGTGVSVTSHAYIGQLYGMLGMVDVADAAPLTAAGDHPRLSPDFVAGEHPDFVFLAGATRVSSFRGVRPDHLVALPTDVAAASALRGVDLLEAVAATVTRH